jgi:sulfur carrier protein ThiS
MRVERLSDLAAPLTERDGFEEPWPTDTFAVALARLLVDDLLAVAHGASGARVDRALGTEPLERSRYEEVELADGDRLELVRAVAGGS